MCVYIYLSIHIYTHTHTHVYTLVLSGESVKKQRYLRSYLSKRPGLGIKKISTFD